MVKISNGVESTASRNDLAKRQAGLFSLYRKSWTKASVFSKCRAAPDLPLQSVALPHVVDYNAGIEKRLRLIAF